MTCSDGPSGSVLDVCRTLALQGGEPVAHSLHPLRRVTDPVDDLAHNPQRLAAAERVRRIPGELLVGDVGVVLELALWLDDVDTAATLAGSELGAPDRGVEGRGEVDVVHHPAGLEVRLAAGNQQVAHRQVCLAAVQVQPGLVDLERHGLTRRAHGVDISHRAVGMSGCESAWLVLNGGPDSGGAGLREAVHGCHRMLPALYTTWRPE